MRGTTEIYLKGINGLLEPGDALLLVGDERLAVVEDNHWDFRILKTVSKVQASGGAEGYTVVTVEPLGQERPRLMNPPARPRAYVLRQRAALFGNNAPAWEPLHEDTKRAYEPNSDKWPNGWPDFKITTVAEKTIDLDRTYPKVLAGSWLVLHTQSYVELYKVESVTTVSRSSFLLTGQAARVAFDTNVHLTSFGLRETEVFGQSEELALAERPVTEPVYGHAVVIDGVLPELAANQPLAFSGKRQRVRMEVAVTLALDEPDPTGAIERQLQPGDTLQLLAAPVLDSAPDQPLSPAQLLASMAQAVRPMIRWQLVDRDSASGLVVAGGDKVALAPAAEDDTPLSEVAVINAGQTAVTLGRDYTTVLLKDPLQNCYDRTTVTINANVVHATHGSTVLSEVLGSGDGGQANQRFWLKKPPLAYVSAATPSGLASTLSVASTGCSGRRRLRFMA